MKIETRINGLTAVTFDGSLEVESTRRAFEEHNAYRMDRGNSIDEFDRWVQSWRGYVFKYTCRCYSLEPLIEPLEYFIDNTEAQVDEILDQYDTPSWKPETRIRAAAYRYRLMATALDSYNALVDYIGKDDSALAIY